jgi:hypothetical protein
MVKVPGCYHTVAARSTTNAFGAFGAPEPVRH